MKTTQEIISRISELEKAEKGYIEEAKTHPNDNLLESAYDCRLEIDELNHELELSEKEEYRQYIGVRNKTLSLIDRAFG